MENLFRGMRAASDGYPLCGEAARALGVRVPADIAPDASGLVHPGAGGMSVAPDDPLLLPPHRRPRSLRGTGPDPVYSLRVMDLGGALRAWRDAPHHAFVEPAEAMALRFYVAALQATRLRRHRITP